MKDCSFIQGVFVAENSRYKLTSSLGLTQRSYAFFTKTDVDGSLTENGIEGTPLILGQTHIFHASFTEATPL